MKLDNINDFDSLYSFFKAQNDLKVTYERGARKIRIDEKSYTMNQICYLFKKCMPKLLEPDSPRQIKDLLDRIAKLESSLEGKGLIYRIRRWVGNSVFSLTHKGFNRKIWLEKMTQRFHEKSTDPKDNLKPLDLPDQKKDISFHKNQEESPQPIENRLLKEESTLEKNLEIEKKKENLKPLDHPDQKKDFSFDKNQEEIPQPIENRILKGEFTLEENLELEKKKQDWKDNPFKFKWDEVRGTKYFKPLMLYGVTVHSFLTSQLDNAPTELLDDKEFMKVMVAANCLALKRASKPLQDDMDLVLVAVRNNVHSIEFASERLQKDPEMLRVIEELKK